MEVMEELANDTPGCCYFVTMYFLIFIFGGYFLLTAGFSIYVGITYNYCQDPFSPWLIVGGILVYGNLILFLVMVLLKRCFDVKHGVVMPGMICVVSVSLVVWWIWGFGRIHIGSMDEEPVMEDPVCKEYLYSFPFWLTITPYIMVPVGFVGWTFLICLE